MGWSVPARLGELDYSSPTLVLPPAPQQSWVTKIWETSVTLPCVAGVSPGEVSHLLMAETPSTSESVAREASQHCSG